MLIKLAWRNLWRNPRRTLITLASILFAVVLSVYMRAMQDGAFGQMVRNMVSYYSGYVQVHKEGYWEEQTLDNSFAYQSGLEEKAKEQKAVLHAVPRLEAFALAANANFSRPTLVVGIEPMTEDGFTQLADRLVDGRYLEAEDSGALLGKELAEKLQLTVGDTLILIGQGYHGATAAGLYPVKGLVKFGSPDLNRRLVYLSLSEAQKLYGAENRLTAFAIDIEDPEELKSLMVSLREEFGEEYEVMDWKEMMPEIQQFIEGKKGGSYLIIGLLYMIIAFGVFGTVLMMTMERHFEFGVMVAIGMNRLKLAIVVVMETFFIGILGVLGGLGVSYPLVWWFNKHPIVFTGEMAEVYDQFGMEPIIPTSLNPENFYTQALIVGAIAMVVSLFPLIRILKLNPLESMKA